MTREEARAWLQQHRGVVTPKEGGEGSTSVPQLLEAMKTTYYNLAVGDLTVDIAVRPQPAADDILLPFLVEYWLQVHGE